VIGLSGRSRDCGNSILEPQALIGSALPSETVAASECATCWRAQCNIFRGRGSEALGRQASAADGHKGAGDISIGREYSQPLCFTLEAYQWRSRLTLHPHIQNEGNVSEYVHACPHSPLCLVASLSYISGEQPGRQPNQHYSSSCAVDADAPRHGDCRRSTSLKHSTSLMSISFLRM
jgi:hypothetical protein